MDKSMDEKTIILENQKLKEELEAEKFILSQVYFLNDNNVQNEFCNQLLENLGRYFHARRVYIYQTRSDYFLHTYEWHEEGLSDFVHFFQNMPFSSAMHWTEHFKSSESIYIENLKDVGSYIKDVEMLLVQHGLTSAIVVPIYVEKTMIGFMAIENPDKQKAYATIRLLSMLGNFMGNVARSKKEAKDREQHYWASINEVLQNTKDAVLVAKIQIDSNGFSVISGTDKDDFVDITTHQDFIRKMQSTLCTKEDRALLADILSKENLLHIYKSKAGWFEHFFFQKSMYGMDARRKMQVQIVKNPNTDEMEAVLYVQDITTDYISDKVSKTLLSRYCEGAWILDLNQDLVTGIEIENYQGDSLSFRGTIKDHNFQIAKSMIVEAEQTEFMRKASLEEINKNIHKKEPYVIYATVAEKSGKMSRRKFTNLFLEKERNVVICIMEDNSYEYETEMQLTREIEKEVQEKQQISKKQQFTDTMFRQLLNLQSSGVLAYSELDHELITINESAMKMLDFSSFEECEDFLRTGNSRIVIEDYDVIKQQLDNLSIYSEPVSYEYEITRKDRSVVKAFAKTKVIELDRGYRVVISSFVDISEKAKLEQELHEERKQYRDALLHNSLFSYTFDINTGIVNQLSGEKNFTDYLARCGMTFPMPYDQFIQTWVNERKPHFLGDTSIEALSCVFLRNLYQHGKTTYEYEYFDEEKNAYMRASVLMSENMINHHITACVIVKNVTDVKRKEDAIKQALQSAFEAANMANNAKTDFLSRMSHDIRTPMNAIIGMTAIAAAHIEDKERVADALEKITSSSKHLLGLINEILDMSKIESGKLELAEEEFNLPELIEGILTMVKPLVKEKNHELTIQVKDLKHEIVYGDTLRIQQVFVNIISNAVKYTPDYGKICVTINEKTEKQNKMGCFEFTFEDNGIGMSPEYLEHLFEPFERAKDTRINKIQGTGLGMTITRNIVRLMNGNIQVESKLGEGSKFIVTIYLKTCDESHIEIEELKNLSVLVVDDEQYACENTCEMLHDIGMTGEWVLSGKEAIQKVIQKQQSKENYFAIIIDWKMSEMDGVETTRALREHIGDTPIIVLSAYDWTEIEEEAKQAGVNSFMSKPMYKSGLIKTFKKLVNGKNNEEIGLGSVASKDYTGKRVLLVEDNDLNREIATEILQMTNLTVDDAENGQIAVDKIVSSAEGYYDIVLMDIQMPVMNGYEATKAIRSLKRNDVKSLPILAMTANAFAEDIQDALDAGMNEHLSKPLELPVLMDALSKWLKS